MNRFIIILIVLLSFNFVYGYDDIDDDNLTKDEIKQMKQKLFKLKRRLQVVKFRSKELDLKKERRKLKIPKKEVGFVTLKIPNGGGFLFVRNQKETYWSFYEASPYRQIELSPGNYVLALTDQYCNGKPENFAEYHSLQVIENENVDLVSDYAFQTSLKRDKRQETLKNTIEWRLKLKDRYGIDPLKIDDEKEEKKVVNMYLGYY